MHTHTTTSPRTRTWRALLSMALLAACLSMPAYSKPASVLLKAQPQLIELSRTKPDSTVAVIVQKADQSDVAEKMLAQLGGRVTMSLGIINAFAAELPAKAVTALAQSAAVRWVSLDSEMEDSSWKGDSNQPGGAAPGGYQVAIDAGQAVTNGVTGYQVAITNTDGSVSNGLNTMPLQTLPTLETNQVGAQVVIPALPADAGTMTADGEIIPAKPLVDDDPLASADPANTAIRRTSWSPGDRKIDQAALRNVYPVAVRAGAAWLQGYSGSGVGVAVIDSGIHQDFDDFKDDYWQPRVQAATGFQVDNNADMACSNASAGASVGLTFVNNSTRRVNLFWRDTSCKEYLYATIWPYGNNHWQQTYNGHMWVVRDADTNAVMKTHKANGGTTISFGDLPSGDAFGHGTHVAGIIGGAGRFWTTGVFAGIAPNADLVDVRVIKDDGSARASNIVAGMQWVLENKAKYNIRVVNISLNSAAYESYHTNPLCAAAEVLWFNGIVVVVSAGNRGGGNLFPPANDPFVITVGATDDKGTLLLSDDTLAPFSAYGVADGVSKPDLVAPGRFIASTMPVAKLVRDGRAKLVELDYYKMSGTSMASPVVAGAVAMLLEKEPNLTPDQVKYRLKNTATPFVSTTVAGSGLLNVYKALNTVTTASANTGSPMSKLLTGGTTKSWASVSWSSVSWSSVSWSSVSWSSVSWSSDYVEP